MVSPTDRASFTRRPTRRPTGNDNTVVVEQPFGKDFDEQSFDRSDAGGDRPADVGATPIYSDASAMPASSASVGGRIQRSMACHNVNEIG